MQLTNRFLRLGAIAAAASLAVHAASAATAPAKAVANGEHWTVADTTRLSELRIGAGATLDAPAGKLLTLTVDGVETAIAAGTYKGDVVLTPTRQIDVRYKSLGQDVAYGYRAAVFVHDGVHVPEQSVTAAAIGGKFTDGKASDVGIASVGENFNGIFVDGKGAYTIDHPTITLTGNGHNDFAGLGAGIAAAGGSTVTVNHAKISTHGAIRPAIWVGDAATIVVNDSDIDTRDGTLPADYHFDMLHSVPGKFMMEVPWPLGLKGNARATVLTGGGTAYYNRSRIRSEGWGGLGVDGAFGGRLFATDTQVTVDRSGYGAYADGDVLDTFSHTRFDVPDYGLIMGGGSVILTDGSVIDSRRIGVMAHNMGLNLIQPGIGKLTVEKDSVINAEKAVIQLKSVTTTILVDGATLNSRSGLILQAMVNDDPNVIATQQAMAAGNGGGPPPLPPLKYTAPADGNDDIDATFRNTTLKGDFVNAMTPVGGMNLVFENATVTGAISTATAKHAVGPNGETLHVADTFELVQLIGDEVEALGPVADKHGVSVSLDARSKWTVARTSWLNRLALAQGATVAAPAGECVAMTVDGNPTPIAAGVHTGKIVLTVAKVCKG